MRARTMLCVVGIPLLALGCFPTISDVKEFAAAETREREAQAESNAEQHKAMMPEKADEIAALQVIMREKFGEVAAWREQYRGQIDTAGREIANILLTLGGLPSLDDLIKGVQPSIVGMQDQLDSNTMTIRGLREQLKDNALAKQFDDLELQKLTDTVQSSGSQIAGLMAEIQDPAQLKAAIIEVLVANGADKASTDKLRDENEGDTLEMIMAMLATSAGTMGVTRAWRGKAKPA